MKSLQSHGSRSLLFMMKVMVLYFVHDTHKVMTTLILFILVLVLLEQTQQLPSKFLPWSFLCNLIDMLFSAEMNILGCYGSILLQWTMLQLSLAIQIVRMLCANPWSWSHVHFLISFLSFFPFLFSVMIRLTSLSFGMFCSWQILCFHWK
jgi:hypothetical protein